MNTPGVIYLSGNERLLDIIASCGGLATSRFSGSTEELADLSAAIFIRNGRQLPVDFIAAVRSGDPRHNIIVEVDDYIYIPSSLNREVYVLGAVDLPQVVAFGEGITLSMALASAGGLEDNAKAGKILLQRRLGLERRVARVDLTAITTGHVPDIALFPGDVVYVPHRGEDHLEHLWEAARTGSAASFGFELGATLYPDNRPTGSGD